MPSLFPLPPSLFLSCHLLLPPLPPPPSTSSSSSPLLTNSLNLHSTFKALLVFLAVPAIGMLLQSRPLRGALKVLKADFALDRLGCGVLYWYHYTIQSVSQCFAHGFRRGIVFFFFFSLDYVRLLVASLWSRCPLRCAHASAVLLLRCPF